MNTPHILTTFEESLQILRNDALMMGSLTIRNLANAGKGLFDRDEDWCNTVIVDDEEIDDLEVLVDQNGIALMLRFSPLASDLRTVVSTMKLSMNLERIADQCVNIARRGRRLLTKPVLPETHEIQPTFEMAETMLKDAIRAYADADIELARSLKLRDRALDALNRDFAERITLRMSQDVENIPAYIDLIFISRFLERIGDQAKNIGEDTVYAISAEETRHSNRGASPLEP
jgi:phosphate transport system protein